MESMEMWANDNWQTIEYRLVDFVDGSQATWDWIIYAGEDGSILAHVPRPAARGRLAWISAGDWVRLRQTRNNNGYWLVSIRRRNSSKTYRVHQLVAQAFHGAPLGIARPVAMHLDSDKDNNEPSNLRWGTQEENRAHESDPSVKESKRAFRESLSNVRISLFFDSKKCVGTLQTDFQLPDGNTCTGTAAGTIVDTLLYRYAWALRGVADFYIAMPEKREAVYRGIPSLQTDSGACCPVGFGAISTAKLIERNSDVYLQCLQNGQNWLPYSSRFPAESDKNWSFSKATQLPDW